MKEFNQNTSENEEELEKINNTFNYKELKNPIILLVLSFLFFLPQFDSLFSLINLSFIISDGVLTIQGIFIKSILFATVYFLIHKYLNV